MNLIKEGNDYYVVVYNPLNRYTESFSGASTEIRALKNAIRSLTDLWLEQMRWNNKIRKMTKHLYDELGD